MLGEKNSSGGGGVGEIEHQGGDEEVKDVDAIKGTVDAASEAADMAVFIADRISEGDVGFPGERRAINTF